MKDVDPGIAIVEKDGGVFVTVNPGEGFTKQATTLVTSGRLGKARVSGAGYENPDGTPLKIDADYFGKPRNAMNPGAGPFANPTSGKQEIKVW